MSKKFLMLAITLFAALALVACAPSGSTTEGGESAEGGEAAEAEPAAAADVAEAEPTPVVNAFGDCSDPLILWHGLTGADGAVFAEMLEQFTNDADGICLRSEGIPWDLFFQKYPTAVAAGAPPDLVIFHAAEVNQMASEGLMTPLDEIFYADSPYGKEDFNDVLIEQITVDGQTMAVPFDNHGWLLWYNKQIIEDAGLDPEVLPANGTEFIEWGQQITTDANGLHPNEEGFDPDNVEIWAMYPTWTRFTIPSTLWQFGGGVVSEDGTEVLLDSPESIAAIQYLHDLMYEYHVMAPWEAYSTWAGDYYQPGRLAIMWEGTWLGGFFRDNPDLIPITGIGYINSLAPDGNQAVKFDSHIFSIPTGVDEDGIEKAKALMIYLLENGAYWTNAGQVPALLSVQQSEEVQAVESVATAAEQFNAIGRTDFAHPAFIEIQTAYETAVGNALSDPNGSVEQALIAGAEQIQAILDRP